MKNKPFFLMTLLTASVLLLLIANSCQTESNTLQIRIGDLYFKPDKIELKAGDEVKIELVNEGKFVHEFMVGRGVKMEGNEGENHEELHDHSEGKAEASEVEHEHHKGGHEAHIGMSKSFEKDFFEGINVVAQTENGAEFMRVPRHGTMVTLKPEGRATLTFKIPSDRKGEWEMACFVPGHYEAKMMGHIIVK